MRAEMTKQIPVGASLLAMGRPDFDGVHIRFCGNGRLRFRPYGGSLSKSAKVTKALCPAIRCLAQARHALTPALLRGPAAIGHPWPGAATAASLPRCPLRNTCVRPLGKGRTDQDQKQKQKQKQKQRQDKKIAAFGSSYRRNMYMLLIRPVGRPPRFAFAVHAPSRGRVEVLRSGQPGMDAGLAAYGHGWPIAAGPRSRTGARACRA